MHSGQLPVAELLRREGRAEEATASHRTRVHRMLAAAAGTILVCSIVISAAAALASGPRLQRASPERAALEHITGPVVIRPDLINLAMTPPRPAESSHAAPADASNGSATATGEPLPQLGRSLPAGGAPAAGGPPAEGTATGDGADVHGGDGGASGDRAGPSRELVGERVVRDTVTSFYDQVLTAPAEAYATLAPEMQGSGYEGFLVSWSDVEHVAVSSFRSDGTDAAIVTVVMERADGSVLRSVQRVMVRGAPPRIARAQLLSASAS